MTSAGDEMQNAHVVVVVTEMYTYDCIVMDEYFYSEPQ